MKKLFATLIVVLFLSYNMIAQEYVSTQPETRGVLIEHFGGINCGYCPDGHRIANEIAANNPGKVWVSSIHVESYAPTAYPNFNTDDGNDIHNSFDISGYPAGLVNRTTDNGLARNLWENYTNEQLAQTAECNIGGKVVINRATRTATFEVEFYYTSNSEWDINQYNIIMVQDSIWGPQSNGNTNPSQYVNGEYCHMHSFRDAITPTSGTELSPTTAGSYIPLEFTYQIPDVIGNPNGVDVDLNNIHFLVFVTGNFIGSNKASRPILNVAELECVIEGTSEPNYARIKKIMNSAESFSCSNEKVITLVVENVGTNDISSLQFISTVNGGAPSQHSWNGTIAAGQDTNIDIELILSEGDNDVMVEIVKINNVDFGESATEVITNDGWIDLEINAIEEEITIEVAQDKYGDEISWNLYGSDNSIIASGGPYEKLSSNGILLHEHKVNVNAGECIKFVIEDKYGDGFCSDYGEGYYRILNANGDVILDKTGDIGPQAEHILSVISDEIAIENIEVEICEGESYTEYGFEFIEPEAGTYTEQNTYNGVIYKLTLTVFANPDVTIEGDNEISSGGSVTLTASGADSYLWSTGEVTASITVSPTETTTYSVVGTTNGCEGNAEFTVNVTVGIDENISAEIIIYPNPTNGDLNIHAAAMKQISIINAMGQIIYSQDVVSDDAIIDMAPYNAGIYMIRIITENGTIVKRVNVVK